MNKSLYRRRSSEKAALWQMIVKRGMDIKGGLLGLVLLSPVFLVVAVLVKVSSRGPIFFRYERIGHHGKRFKPFKFRTMCSGALEKGLGYTVSTDDARITKVGAFLRKWGIDELPQLFNVLKGDMSLVGPRPTFRYQVEKYTPFQRKRLLVKPGITSWALIHGRNALPWKERICYDVWYVEHWSLKLDLIILLKTLYVILIKRTGVYGEGGVNDDPFI